MPDPTTLQPGSYIVPAPPPPVTVAKTILPALQIAPFELLWGVGRSKPVNNPVIHGTATWTPGEPSTLDYHPVNLPNDRDNLYCLRRLGQYLPDFSAATKFTESQIYQVSDISAPEALEADWHMQPVGNKVFNPGIQLLPSKTLWFIRLWDHIKGDWELATRATFDGNVLASGALLGGEYTITPAGLIYTAVTLNGIRFPQNYSVFPKIVSPVTQQVFNKAVQVDANGSATPYMLKIGQLTVNYS